MKRAAAALVLLVITPVVARAAGDGARLYQTYCSSCHGLRGEGSNLAPPLIGVSGASVHFMLDSGRMPAPAPSVNEISQPPHFTGAQIDRLVAYVLDLSPPAARGSPALPVVAIGNAARGRALFAANCAQCHGAAGDGASVGADDVAPDLAVATNLQIGEAIRVGPGVMPRFGPEVLSDRDVDDIASFVRSVETDAEQRNGPDAGGFPLAHLGPVAEGFIAWVFGLGALVLFVRRIGL